MKKTACPMVARSDWGVGTIQQRGIAHSFSLYQSSIGFHGPRTAGWLVFLNGAHRGEDIRLPVGESKIGSSWNCDVVLTGVGIGSKHATIKLGTDEGNITPLSASREIRINNALLEGSSVIKDGDLVTIGDLNAIFRYSAAEVPGYETPAYAKPESMPVQSVPKIMTCGWLVVSKGTYMGQDFRLINGINRVGSKPGLEVCISDPNLVQFGFALECSSSKGCVVRTLQDGRALKVNGSVCEVGKQLKDSDVIAFDHLEMLVKWL